MVELEAQALEALDKITPAWTDLVIPKPPKATTIPSDPIALMLDMEFS